MQPAPSPERSIQELLTEATSEMNAVVRREVNLARIEAKEQISRFSKAGVLFGSTAVAGLLTLLLLSFAAAFGLAALLPTGLAFLVVAILYGAVAALVFVRARQQMATATPGPQQTVETPKEEVR